MVITNKYIIIIEKLNDGFKSNPAHKVMSILQNIIFIIMFSTSMAYQWPVDSPHKGPVAPKMFPIHDAIVLIHKVTVNYQPCALYFDNSRCMANIMLSSTHISSILITTATNLRYGKYISTTYCKKHWVTLFVKMTFSFQWTKAIPNPNDEIPGCAFLIITPVYRRR